MADAKGGAPTKQARTAKRFDRYEVLIEAAADIFQRQGYDATSLQQIADAVGILKGSVYHYIDTKEDLLYAIIERNHDQITQNNSQWRELVQDPMAALESFIAGHLRESMRNPVYTSVFIRDFRALSSERSQVIRKTQDAYAAEFRDLVVAARDQGRLRSDVEPAWASRAVFGMTNWVSYWFKPGADVETAVSQMTRYALASLMEPASPI